MSAWSEYKKKLGETRPWDAIKRSNYTTEEIAQNRLDICLACDRLIAKTKQCKECGCFMAIKTKLENATCPLGKW